MMLESRPGSPRFRHGLTLPGDVSHLDNEFINHGVTPAFRGAESEQLHLTLPPHRLPPDARPLRGAQVGQELAQLAFVFRLADKATD